MFFFWCCTFFSFLLCSIFLVFVVEYIFSLIDAPTRIGEFPKTSFNSKKQSAAMNKDVETVSEIFRRLEPELVEKLYQKYKWDFVLFDYSHEEFFNRTGMK